MHSLITIGDISETVYFIKNYGTNFILKRISFIKTNRTKNAWNSTLQKRRRTNWWEIPAIQKRWNKKITGEEDKTYFEYLNEKYFKKNSIILSPGCGTGTKEMALARFDKIKSIDAFDISPERIEYAKSNKKKSMNINFFVSDIEKFRAENKKYDIVIFDSFLHHVKNPNKILGKISRFLKDDGFLIINEYVGPKRFNWTKEQITAANSLLHKIPAKLRKREFDGKVKNFVSKPGLLRMWLSDPSEAVNSSDIRNAIYQHFEIIEEKPYGGNLLQLVLKDISHNFLEQTPEQSEILKILFEEEDRFISGGKSDFLFGIYKKN